MIRRLLPLLAAGLVAATACAAPEAAMPMPLMSWEDLTSRPLSAPGETIRTGEGETDIVDLWLPEGEGPHPVVLMIHGGCWQKEIADRTLMNYAAEALRQEGIAVWNIEYRGIDEPGGGYPGTFLDVARQADALRDLGPVHGLDTSRIVAFGHSAGGHLSLWAAARHKLPPTSALYTEDPVRLYGVVNSGGLADLEASAPVTLPGCLAAIKDKLTGLPAEERSDVLADTSPDRLLPIGAVQVSVNGARDRIAPPELGQAWTLEAEAQGDPARFVEVPGGHVELVAPGTMAFDRQIDIIKTLLEAD